MKQRTLLSTFNLLNLFSLLTRITVCSMNPKFEACEPKTCGGTTNHQNVNFFFYIISKQNSYCGLPNFGLTCSHDNFPILNTSKTFSTTTNHFECPSLGSRDQDPRNWPYVSPWLSLTHSSPRFSSTTNAEPTSIITPDVSIRTPEPPLSSSSSSSLLSFSSSSTFAEQPPRKPFLPFSSPVSCLLCLAVGGYHPAPSQPSSSPPYNLALWLSSWPLPPSFPVAESEQSHFSSSEFKRSSDWSLPLHPSLLCSCSEPDATLGNRGLGRLASCFVNSLATLNFHAWGFSLRYKYGLFKRLIRKDGQEEVAESWLEVFTYMHQFAGDPFIIFV
ncbi:hypothetical protein AHAS_Ahas13G0140100 [Arachis hypogaea]